MTLEKYLLELMLQGYSFRMEIEGKFAYLYVGYKGLGQRTQFEVPEQSFNKENIIDAIEVLKRNLGRLVK